MKPENRFILSVHKHIDKETIYYEKMANPYRGGTPDVYYEGNQSNLWIEYKFFPKLPPVLDLAANAKGLTPLQQDWINRAWGHRRLVGVIVGTSGGGLILPALSFKKQYTREDATAVLKTRKEIACWISKICSTTNPILKT